MSNSKHAYGWSGHILVSRDETDSHPDDNVIAIKPEIFNRIAGDYGNCKLDERINIKRIGVIDSDFMWLAAGANFSEGYQHYGTVFVYAELRAEGHPLALNQDREYLKAMEEIYGLDLPPCRLMVGCSSEH